MSVQRAKGTRFETEVKDYLRAYWWEHAVRTGSASFGAGDIEVPTYLIECKNHKTIDLASFLKQAETAADRVSKLPVVIINRKQRNVAESYTVQPLWAWVKDHRAAPGTVKDVGQGSDAWGNPRLHRAGW